MDPDDLLTVDDVARRLRTGREKVYRLIHTGQLPATKIGRYRIRWADYQAFITPKPAPRKTRTQRDNIQRLLSA